MEVAWHLRLGRRDVVEALVAEKAVGQLEHMLYVETDWQMETTAQEGGVLARLTRKEPGKAAARRSES